MRILVSGAGRSGTNLVTEVARGLRIVEFTKRIEDIKLFDHSVLPENYGTKLATEQSGFSPEKIRMLMKNHLDLHVIFSLRHPVDTCMSKIVRGHIGGKAPDRTVEGSLVAMRHFYTIYMAMMAEFRERTYGAKMESLLLNPQKEVDAIANFLNTKTTKTALEFYRHNRNKFHKERYGNRIDNTQIDIHKRWDTAYNGFFKERKGDIDILNKELRSMAEKLNYGVSA